jgi:hypothetical protein
MLLSMQTTKIPSLHLAGAFAPAGLLLRGRAR